MVTRTSATAPVAHRFVPVATWPWPWPPTARSLASPEPPRGAGRGRPGPQRAEVGVRRVARRGRGAPGGETGGSAESVQSTPWNALSRVIGRPPLRRPPPPPPPPGAREEQGPAGARCRTRAGTAYGGREGPSCSPADLERLPARASARSARRGRGGRHRGGLRRRATTGPRRPGPRRRAGSSGPRCDQLAPVPARSSRRTRLSSLPDWLRGSSSRKCTALGTL